MKERLSQQPSDDEDRQESEKEAELAEYKRLLSRGRIVEFIVDMHLRLTAL